MSIRLSVDPPDGPSSQGTGPVVELRIKNETSDLVLLDEARSDGPDDEVVRWRTFPEGVVVYDALQDEYRHLSLPQTRARIPVWSGAIPPRATAASHPADRLSLAETDRFRHPLHCDDAARSYHHYALCGHADHLA